MQVNGLSKYMPEGLQWSITWHLTYLSNHSLFGSEIKDKPIVYICNLQC